MFSSKRDLVRVAKSHRVMHEKDGLCAFCGQPVSLFGGQLYHTILIGIGYNYKEDR